MTFKVQRHGYVLFPSLKTYHLPVIFSSVNIRPKELSITYWHSQETFCKLTFHPIITEGQTERECCQVMYLLNDLREVPQRIHTIFNVSITHAHIKKVLVLCICLQFNSRNVWIMSMWKYCISTCLWVAGLLYI